MASDCGVNHLNLWEEYDMVLPNHITVYKTGQKCPCVRYLDYVFFSYLSTAIRPGSCRRMIENKESPIISRIIHISHSYLFLKSKNIEFLCLGASPMGIIHNIIIS